MLKAPRYFLVPYITRVMSGPVGGVTLYNPPNSASYIFLYYYGTMYFTMY